MPGRDPTANPLMIVSLAAFLWPATGISAEHPGTGPRTSVDSFTVTIQEQAGIARWSEPTRVSLPFPAGALYNPRDVALLDESGMEVATQFHILAQWDDGSIRWLLTHFLADLPAHGTLRLSAHHRPRDAAVEDANLAVRQGQQLTIDTGLIRVRVGPEEGAGLVVSDQCGTPLMAKSPRLIVYSPTGHVYQCGPPDQADLEVNGPLYSSIFLAGPMQAKDVRYNKILRWETRLHCWRGLARILAEHTVVAVGSAADGVTIIDGIVTELGVTGGLSEYVMAGQTGHHTGRLQPGESVRLEQTCAYWHELGKGPDPDAEPVRYLVLEADFGYQLTTGRGQPLASGAQSAGWLWATGPERSVGVAVRHFWEEGPKALAASADGTLAVECYAHWRPTPGQPRPLRSRTPDYSNHPRLDHWFAASDRGIDAVVRRFLEDTNDPGPVRRGPFRFGQGRAKTTDILYVFDRADQQAAPLETLSALRHFLIPVVDPAYLAATRALPFVWTTARDSGLPLFEQALREMFQNWQRHATRYGFLHYGDDQCAFGYNRTVPSTTDDQEYDTTQCLTMQFARTADPSYLRWASICARHFLDIDQKHPSGELCFHGYAATGDYHEDPGPVDMGGHPYIGGIVNHYMLTGDRRSLRGIDRLARVLRGYATDARNRVLSTDERSLARTGICLTAIFDLTRDPAHLAPVKTVVDAINDLSGDVTNDLQGAPPFHLWWINHNEMCYHVRELLTRYHASTGDPRTLATLRQALDLYIHDLWDSQKVAWRGMFGAPFDFNMQYERAVPREPRRHRATELATAELGMPFAYVADITGKDFYLTPLLDSLDTLGSDFAQRFGNRQFARRQLWSLPLVSMLPPHWHQQRDQIVQREVFRAGLREAEALQAWVPDGHVQGQAHGAVRWVESPFGRVLRTYGTSFVTLPAPANILELPGTLTVWVRRDDATWDRKPWPWYGALRGLIHLGSDARETNALDLMMLKNNLWVRLYDHRGWEMVAIDSASPPWREGVWHHIAVVWNRFDLTVFVDGAQVGHDDRFALPGGGQTTIYVGWRPTNRYGQADYHDLRLFRSALPDQRIRKIYELGRRSAGSS